MTGPIRIQRQRTAGWRMPPNTVYVGRPSKWGNPYTPDNHCVIDGCGGVLQSRAATVAECVAEYREDLRAGRLPFTQEECRRELKGKNLACWCGHDEPCHADVLLETANG